MMSIGDFEKGLFDTVSQFYNQPIDESLLAWIETKLLYYFQSISQQYNGNWKRIIIHVYQDSFNSPVKIEFLDAKQPIPLPEIELRLKFDYFMITESVDLWKILTNQLYF